MKSKKNLRWILLQEKFRESVSGILTNISYFVFLMKPLSALPQPIPDGVETDRAEFLTLEEIVALAPCAQIFKEMAGKALRGLGGSLKPATITAANGRQYTAYM